MGTCSEVLYMENKSIRRIIHRRINWVCAWMLKMQERRSEAAAHRELASLSPWLKNDLGIGDDGRPLDKKR